MSAKGQGGRHSRRKGADAERELVTFLREHGFADATRCWRGAQSLLATERATDVTFAGLRAQVKRRARMDTLYGWLEGVDVCFLRADGKPWLALVPAERLLARHHAECCGPVHTDTTVAKVDPWPFGSRLAPDSAMPTSLQTADYFRWRAGAEGNEDAPELLTNLKLQKLLYYAQGFHLAMCGSRLFPEDVLAWQHGPVVREAWRAHSANGAQPIPAVDDYERAALTPEQTELLDDVYRVYGQFSAWRLRDMTHAEPPWKHTPQGSPIADGAMADYFKTLVVA